MKKTAYILAAAMLIATLAGCNGNSGDSQTTNKDGKVTQVAFQMPEEPDTTDQAVAYLKTQVPLFAKYLETRMQYPLTFETEVQTAEGTMKAAIYIKDEKNICFSSTDAFGMTNSNIYTPEMTYIVIEEDNIIYTSNSTEEDVKKIVADNLLKIDADEARSMEYVTDFDYFNDVLYKHEIIYEKPGVGTHYFFDEHSEDLVYIATSDSTTRITKLKNEVTESAFELPSDYTTKPLSEYFDELESAQTANAE